jgi:peptide/nickel transport system substrate-binding protein
MLLALLAVTLWALAACGGGNGGGEEPAEGEGESADQAAGESGIVYGLDQEPDILNTFIVGGDLAVASQVTDGILESPLKVSPNIEDLESAYEPELATEQPEVVSEDPLTIEYTIHEDATWSDGEPVTAEDARWTYEQIMNEDNQIITRVGWELVEEFEAVDDKTVRITFSEPYAPWRVMMTSAILPQHIYEGEDFNTALNDEIIGSGPFVFEEWNRGNSLTLTKNENYWGEEPGLDQVTFRFIPDSQTLINSLESGEVDFIDPQLDIGLLERLQGLEEAGNISLQLGAGTQWEHIAFNLERVDDLRLRQAIAYGINRQQIIDEVLQGEVEVLNSVIMPQQEIFYTPAWEQYTYDPDRARQLVEEIEADGGETSITFSTTAEQALRVTLQEIVQQQLADVGIDVRIDNVAAQTFFGEWTPQGNFEMGEWAWLSDPDPTLTTLFAATSLPPDGQNYYRYENEQVTEWLQQADVTVDEQERADLLIQVQEQMAEDLPLIPMYQRIVIYAYNPALEGPEMNPTIAGPTWNIGEWSISR